MRLRATPTQFRHVEKKGGGVRGTVLQRYIEISKVNKDFIFTVLVITHIKSCTVMINSVYRGASLGLGVKLCCQCKIMAFGNCS